MPFLGIAFIFILFVVVSVLISLLVSAILIFACMPLVYSLRKTELKKRLGLKKKLLLMSLLSVIFSGSMIGLGVLGFISVLVDEPNNKIEENLDLIKLPAEATITKVDNGYWAGDFSVEFQISSDETVEELLETVWELNSEKLKGFPDGKYQKTNHSIGVYCHGVAHMSITYNFMNGTYTFEHYFES